MRFPPCIRLQLAPIVLHSPLVGDLAIPTIPWVYTEQIEYILLKESAAVAPLQQLTASSAGQRGHRHLALYLVALETFGSVHQHGREVEALRVYSIAAHVNRVTLAPVEGQIEFSGEPSKSGIGPTGKSSQWWALNAACPTPKSSYSTR